ncbi:MAG: SPOR domain-containing protein, partial [Gammaproteobacteria bacterium]|nr:SPOR domain-containing protein [Gammaproteobacteria bacterium]
RDVAWLLKQPGDSYSLQLFGARNRAAAAKFVATHRHADLWLLTARHQGAPWYVVLYGLYPDRDSARRAIAGLPAGLRQSEPWARPVSSLREIAQ